MNIEDFILFYVGLLIAQYSDKPDAREEINFMATYFSKIFIFFEDFAARFDLDFAVANELDIIGKVVGLSRSVPSVIPKVFFGFAGTPNTLGYADLENPEQPSAPFFDLREDPYTDLQLNDTDYRFFLKAKILI